MLTLFIYLLILFSSVKKVLVIENEIGAEGIDHELLMKHTVKEEIILMNNGCICCTGQVNFCYVHKTSFPYMDKTLCSIRLYFNCL